MCQDNVPPYEKMSKKMQELHDRLWERFRFLDIDRVKTLRVVLAEALPIFEELETPATVYDPEYGDDRECKCGHTYYRHFDSYENMDPTGCKYCGCGGFVEKAFLEKAVQAE